MLTTDRINCTLDFERDGKHFGSLELGFSDNRHAFACIPVPVVCIKNGEGSTLLLSAGNHGDEYEGQVILRRLLHELSASDISGRVILLPALNYPAMLENARVSPLDQGNMNRSFPGIEGGPPTAAIAHYVSSSLLPLADAGIDLHSGGATACYLPSAFLCTADDASMTQRNLELIDAFNAPVTLVVDGRGSATGFDPVANRAGVPFISTELCGGANVDVEATAIGWRGVRNVMRHLGILDGEVEAGEPTRFLNGIDGSGYLSAPFSGIFEPCRQLGDEVVAGDIAGRLYSAEEVEREPLELNFDRSGLIMVRRNGARVTRGSHLFMVASETGRDDVLAHC
jgi:predicted deacylase